MSAVVTDELLRVIRLFGIYERDAVCCGTVTVGQCVALQVLRDGAQDNASLAARLGLSPSATTRLVDGLVKRGWVQRSQSEADRRQVQIGLTSAGRDEAGRLRGLTESAVDAVMAEVPEAERAGVERSLRVLGVAMERARDAPRGCCGLP
jgi:DNA-binding MarR family transcriptional regulator